jgi:uncharacterized protein (DUF983 family)
VNTTRDCSACGSTEVFDQVTDLTHVCKACGAEWGAQPDQIAEAMFQRLQDRQQRGKLQGSGDAR